ncbi:hypothetical protein PM082_022372 [Marasmius tenuissimus]|nr:hypothetical protein PM082_022372 [Marasmius tenuissimus]
MYVLSSPNPIATAVIILLPSEVLSRGSDSLLGYRTASSQEKRPYERQSSLCCLHYCLCLFSDLNSYASKSLLKDLYSRWLFTLPPYIDTKSLTIGVQTELALEVPSETSTDQEADAAILEVVEATEVGEIATVTEAEDALTRSKVEATATEIAITATAAAAAEETTIVIVSEDEGQRIQREHRMLRKL